MIKSKSNTHRINKTKISQLYNCPFMPVMFRLHSHIKAELFGDGCLCKTVFSFLHPTVQTKKAIRKLYLQVLQVHYLKTF